MMVVAMAVYMLSFIYISAPFSVNVLHAISLLSVAHIQLFLILLLHIFDMSDNMPR